MLLYHETGTKSKMYRAISLVSAWIVIKFLIFLTNRKYFMKKLKKGVDILKGV